MKDASSRSIGVLAAHLSWEWSRQVESSILTPLKENMKGVEIFVVSKDDNMIVLGPASQVGKPMKDPALAQARQGKSSWLINKSEGGQSYLTGYAHGDGYMDYPGLGWSVIIRQPADIAFASVHRLQNYIAISGLAVAVLFGIGGWFLAGWIVRPLQLIAESADLLSAGNEAEIPKFNRIKDLSILSDSLRNLVNNLSQTETELFYMPDRTRHDALTGLPNRMALDDYLAYAVSKAKQNRSTLSFLYLDLDGFKKVNDTLGHASGDKLLQEVSFRLLESTRDNEMVSRIGEMNSWLFCTHLRRSRCRKPRSLPNASLTRSISLS